jgi:hypothetical protein
MVKKLKTEIVDGKKVQIEKINDNRYNIMFDGEVYQDVYAYNKEALIQEIRDFINSSTEGLEAWEKKAKKELEKQLAVKTIVKEYDYYNEKGALFLVSTSGTANNGESEWIVFENESAARQAAEDKVEDDLEQEPYIFNQSWLENYIDDERLKNALYSDVSEMARSYWDYIESESDSQYGNRQIQELISEGFLDESDITDENAIYNAIEKAVEKRIDEDLEDPVQYLKDMLGDEDGIKKAIDIAGIDYDQAKEAAVDEDGVAHFLDGYDGREKELPSGAVAYGVN